MREGEEGSRAKRAQTMRAQVGWSRETSTARGAALPYLYSTLHYYYYYNYYIYYYYNMSSHNLTTPHTHPEMVTEWLTFRIAQIAQYSSHPVDPIRVGTPCGHIAWLSPHVLYSVQHYLRASHRYRTLGGASHTCHLFVPSTPSPTDKNNCLQ